MKGRSLDEILGLQFLVGDRVRGKWDGRKGTVVKANDPHNIHVAYDVGGKGLYCTVKSCVGNDTLERIGD